MIRVARPGQLQNEGIPGRMPVTSCQPSIFNLLQGGIPTMSIKFLSNTVIKLLSKNSKFDCNPFSIIYKKDLSWQAKGVYLSLLQLSNLSNFEENITPDRLSKLSKFPVSILDPIAELLTKKYIVIIDEVDNG